MASEKIMASEKLTFSRRIGSALGLNATTISDGKMALVLVQFVYMICLIVFRSTAYAFDFYEGPQGEGFTYNVQMCSNETDYYKVGNVTNANITDDTKTCFMTQVTYRMGWATSLLFLVLTFMALGKQGVPALTRLFPVKLVFPIIFFLFFIFLWPDVIFQYMAYVAGFASAVAWILMIVMVINAGARLTGFCDEKTSLLVGEEQSSWTSLPAVLGGLFFIASVVGTVFLSKQTVFVEKPETSAINDRRWLSIGSCMFMFCCLCLSVSPLVKHGSFLVSCMMMALVTTLCWGASLNHFDDKEEMSPHLESTQALYLAVLSFWFLLALLAASTESNSDAERRNGEIRAYVDEVEDKNLTGELMVKKLWAMAYLLFHACVPFALMTVISRKKHEDMRNDIHFYMYMASIILVQLFYLGYLLKPVIKKSFYFEGE